MGYDNSRLFEDPQDREPDYRMPKCQTRGCENRVTFDNEAFCSACIVEYEQAAEEQSLDYFDRYIAGDR